MLDAILARYEKAMRLWRRWRTTCCTMPIPYTDQHVDFLGRNPMSVAWVAAAYPGRIVRPGRMVSLMGGAEAILAGHQQAYVDYYRTHLFPQLTEIDTDGAVAVAYRYRPEWMVLFVEANDPEKPPLDVDAANRTRRIVRATSPQTKCLVSMQYDIGGWSLDNFPGLETDGVALTFYPELGRGHEDWTSVPDWYFDPLEAIDRPFIVAECGASSPALQLSLVRALLRRSPRVLNQYFPRLVGGDGQRPKWEHWPDPRFSGMGMTADVQKELFL